MGFTFRKWTDGTIEREIMKIANQFDPPKMPSNREAKEMYGGYGLAMAISRNGGFKYWADKLGLPQGYSETTVGRQVEEEVAAILERYGFDVELTSTKHPYDILANGCVKIDVKAANASVIGGCPAHSYRIAKKQQTCDFYIFRELDTNIAYIVPAHICSGQVQVTMCVGSTKYAPYKEAWDLIGKMSGYYKAIES